VNQEQNQEQAQVAIVTGGAGGLGSAVARRLSGRGVHVVVVDLEGDRAKAVADSLPTPGGWCAADVADEADVAKYVNYTVERFGRIDLHHINAGIPGTLDGIPDVDIADFDRVMAVNVRGAFLGVRAAFQRYRAQRSVGNIVLTASVASLGGSADLLGYHVSKHAVIGLLRNAAVYGGPLGIRVNAVAPGIVPTELFAAAGSAVGGGSDMVKRASTTPLRRAGTPEEIAAAVDFLLSDDSSFITGEVITADGGANAVNAARPSGGAGRWDTAEVDRNTYGDDWSGRP
jgi:NAD(P)-dependent dehydrogenase (short-subunit alcohol dehydrogenase family)